ncbi:hypothetical protein FLK61_27815 [Paenalkalicoccus suaedae]|uniref:Peptidase M50 domain-containing protein n=1 Tax=Paenalkalicoccus suaedae TaxID=2592382 RepID=A0A859FC88_9BACI|nr:hypothetical protein [Paenalkalicoccus suaedae]QKS70560.1 hypothetical protein FLK61_27815 [Paenalkalicoccus suaedae]
MFGWSDIPQLILAFGVVFPLVAFIHELGHFTTTWLFGGKMKFTLGRGKLLFKRGDFEIRRMYFLDSWTQLESLNVNNKWSHAVVYASGSIFNLIPVFILNSLIHNGILEPTLFFFQFAYFSVYFVVFALLPVQFAEDQPSDGKALIDLVKYGKAKGPLE